MTKDQEFYDWYNEEIQPLITEMKARMAKRNEDMEYVFVMSEPKPHENMVPTMTDYVSKECSLPYLLTELIEAQLAPVEDVPKTLN